MSIKTSLGKTARKPVGTLAKVTGVDVSIAKLATRIGRTSTSRSERLILGSRRVPLSFQDRVAHAIFKVSPSGQRALYREVEAGSVVNADMLERLAARYAKNRDMDTAVRLRKRAVEIEPNVAHRYFALAHTLSTTFTPGISRDPIIGLAESNIRNSKDAVKYYQKAYDISPSNAFIAHELGMHYYDIGNYSKSIYFLKQAVDRKPRSDWLMDLARCLSNPNDPQFDEAMLAYEKAFDRNSKLSMALLGVIKSGLQGNMDWRRIWKSAVKLERGRKSTPYLYCLRSRAEQLFGEDVPSEEAVKDVVATRDLADANGDALHPRVQGLIATRLQFLGHWNEGFRLRRDLAERSIDRLGKSSTKDPADLRKLLQSLVYADRLDQALTLMDPAPWRVHDQRVSRQFSKMQADTQLMSGCAEPYIKYSSTAQTDMPLTGDSMMRELIQGKRVAIVGPADSGDRLGHLIDQFDVVVRPRFQPDFSEAQADYLGSRTDITYYSGRDLNMMLSNIRKYVDRGDLKMVVARPLSFDAHSQHGFEWLRFYRQEFSLCFYGSQLGIPRMAYDILQFDPREICLFNTDLYTGKKAFSPGYRPDGDSTFGPYSAANDLVLAHDLKFDFRFLQSMKSAGRLSAQGVSGKVLGLSEEEYVQALEVSGALRLRDSIA